MKENKIFDLKKRLKTKKEGLKFLKTTTIGIPYARLSLDATIRKELQISFFHEITMKLLENDWNNYDELRKLIGLDINYMDNILIELGRNDYINHYGQQITLTEKGKRELQNLKSVKIETELINNLYINLMNGSMVLEPQDINFYKAVKSKIVLNELIDVNLDYLIDFENIIKDLYNLNQRKIDNFKKSYDHTITDELYRIINIEKFEIFYSEELVDMYVTEEDTSFVYQFFTDNLKQNELYASCLREQLINNQNSLDYLFDTKHYFDNKLDKKTNVIPFKELEPLYKKKEGLELIVKQYSKSNSDDLNAEILEIYHSDRIMLYKEYRDFIFALKDTNAEEIFIISNRFYDLTGDSNIISIIGALLSKCKIYIGYLDYPGNNFINSIREQFATRKNLVLKKFTDIDYTSIYVSKDFLIDIYYNPIRVDSNIVLEEIPVITFNKEKTKERLEKIRAMFQIKI